MFVEWGFLLTEIWMLLAIASILGLSAGWLMFGGGTEAAAGGDAIRKENIQLRAKIKGLQDQATGISGVISPKRPKQLDGPKGGKADDLKRIQGIDGRGEQICNMMGIWHYNQIASWKEEEVAWAEDNLQGMKGRVTGDAWVEQAEALANGELTDFAKDYDAAVAAKKAAKKK